MLRKYASEFIVLAKLITDLQEFKPTQQNQLNPLAQLPSVEFNATIRAYWPGIDKLTRTIPLPSVVAQMKRIRRAMDQFRGHEEIIALMNELRNRLEDDLNEQWFLHIPTGHVGHYRDPEPFGSAVLNVFDESRDDIEAAGKCLALGQGTACVFHLMRATEACVQMLGTKLGVNNVEKEWGKILSDLKRKIDAMDKGDTKDKWSECHNNLFTVKQAWRNPTMHPKKTYTPDQAEEVFVAVRTFMRHLATLI